MEALNYKNEKLLSGKHFVKVCHDIRHHGPHSWTQVHLCWVLHGHRVSISVVEPEVFAIGRMEAGTYEKQTGSKNAIKLIVFKLQHWDSKLDYGL